MHGAALRRRRPRSARLLANDLQPAALLAAPGAAADASTPAMEYGALGGIVSGSGPTWRFLVRDASGALDLAVAAAGPSGRRAGARRATGPVPGARLGRPGRSTAGWPGQPRQRRARPLAFGTAQVLDDVSLGVAAGDRIGVVGRNGGGKTTLLRGAHRRRRARHRPGDHAAVASTVGVLDAGRHAGPRRTTVRDVVLRRRVAAEHEWAGDARVRDVLDRLLGGSTRGVGGWTRRSARCPAASAAGSRWPRCSWPTATCCVLDEPTNHLDVEGVAWLADHLSARRRSGARSSSSPTTGGSSTRCATTTWEVADGAGALLRRRLRGVRARPGRARRGSRPSPRSGGATCCARSWPGCAAARRRAPASRSSGSTPPKALIADEPPARDASALERLRRPRGSARTSSTSRTTPSRPGGSGRCSRPDLARSGPATGSASSASTAPGKTTLLRLLVGETPPDAGPVSSGQTVAPAYLSQEVRELAEADGRGCWRRSQEVARVARIGNQEISASLAGRAVRLLAAAASGRRSATCPAASGGGCSCCACSWPSRTCCCSTSRPTTSTSTR